MTLKEVSGKANVTIPLTCYLHTLHYLKKKINMQQSMLDKSSKAMQKQTFGKLSDNISNFSDIKKLCIAFEK